jgi:hypothetical protein
MFSYMIRIKGCTVSIHLKEIIDTTCLSRCKTVGKICEVFGLRDRPAEVGVKSFFIPAIFQEMKQQHPEINGGPDADNGDNKTND